MRTIIASLLFCLPIIAATQINSSIDLILGGEYSFRNLSTSSDEGINAYIIKSRDDREKGKLNRRLGFNYNKRIYGKLFLKTGIRLASTGYDENLTDLKWPTEHDGIGGWTPDPSLPHEIKFSTDYWFLEMPVAGRYEFSGKRLAPYFELGLSPAIYLTTRVKQTNDIGTEKVEFQNGDVHNFNKAHLIGSLSFGANYLIGKNMQLFAQPIFRYHLTKLADAPIGEYLFNYGIEMGVRRKIG